MKTMTNKVRRAAATRRGEASSASPAEMGRRFQAWQRRHRKPQRLEVAKLLIAEAWDLVHYMTAHGMEFASPPQQAALTIAGSAYAAWRCSLPDTPNADRDPSIEIVRGFTLGILWATWMGEGMPSELADDYLELAEWSDSELDRMAILEAVAELWPEIAKDGRLRLPVNKMEPIDPNAWDADRWERRPNVLTSPVEELRKAARAAAWARAARQKGGSTRTAK